MTRFHFALLIVVSFAVGLTAPQMGDFGIFYAAGQAVRSGVNPYSVAGYYNPIHVALIAAPLSIVPFDVAFYINAGVMFGIYALAMHRIAPARFIWLVAMFAPWGLLIAYYGNLDALVLLGVTLPAPIGVWLLLAKPQIGLFAAGLILWKRRDWRLAAAVGATLVVSLALGMLHTTPMGERWNASVWPWGLVVGVPLLVYAWRKRDEVVALGAACFVSPYMSILSWCAALPLFRINRRVMAAGVALSWVVFVVWRERQ